MSRRSRTGEVDPIPTPEAPSGRSARASADFDFGDIDAAIGDLTSDVAGGPVQAVELPPPVPVGSPDSALARLAELEAGFNMTDEQLPVPEPVGGYDRPSPFAVTGDQKDSAPVPPALHPLTHPAEPRIPPPTGQNLDYPPSYPAPSAPPPNYAYSSPPPPGGPSSGPLPVARPIQNVETAYVRNPLLSSRAPAPVAEPSTEPYGPTTGQPEVDTPPRGRLVVQGGDWNGTTWYLNRAETRLGRGEENDIVVLDIGVSRHHMTLVRHPHGFRLVDLQSGNGTYVNGRRVVEAEMFDGDRIDLGHTSLIFGTIGQPRLRGPGSVDPGRGGRPLPTSWLIVMALTTFVTVLGTMYLVRTLAGDSEPSAMAQSLEAVANQDWVGARGALERAREAGADDGEIAELGARIEREEQAGARIEQAREKLSGSLTTEAAQAMPETVQQILAEVPATSVYFGEARTLQQQAHQLRIGALLSEAERLVDDGKSVLARVKVRQVLEEEPGNPRAKDLRRTLDALENR